jgi:predicted RNA-binding protein associated with RNAse of E/G family
VASFAGESVTVQKVDYATGQVVLSWPATLIERSDAVIAVQATFRPRSAQTVVVDGVPFEAGDLFTEYYYLECWYNVFHIADARGQPKGWYCNVTRPPDLTDGTISYIDLALDLFVHPDGAYTILDEDEFAAARAAVYEPADAEQALQALEALILLARQGELPSPAP